MYPYMINPFHDKCLPHCCFKTFSLTLISTKTTEEQIEAFGLKKDVLKNYRNLIFLMILLKTFGIQSI